MKKKSLITVSLVAVVILLISAAVFLYERSKVAMIIEDKAAWDVRDSLSLSLQGFFLKNQIFMYLCPVRESNFWHHAKDILHYR